MEMLLLLLVIFVFVRVGEAQSKPFLLDCGTNSSVTIDGRRWVGDLSTNNTNLTLSSSTGIPATTNTLSGDSIFEPVYKSARVFEESLNYTFGTIKGNYIVRLHFCPFPFENYNANDSSFDVAANGLKLLSQFSAPGEISHRNLNLHNSGGNTSLSSLVKEYVLGINSDKLVIELIPSKGSFGFINAIEIVPVVDKLFDEKIRKVGGNDVSMDLSTRGIETMYRLNVGGPEIKPNHDSDLWRKWEVDSSYMITANAGSEIRNSSNITYASGNDSSVAPLLVYETGRTMSNTEVLDMRFNMSWKFEVDPDFDYLVRLHFCELVYDKANQRIFKIYINNMTAANNFDIYEQAGGMNRAYHQDYFDKVSSKSNTLWIQLGPALTAGASGTDALLNGLEIFKLSQNGNLASKERYDSAGKLVGRSRNLILWVGLGAGIASVAVFGVVFTVIYCFCKKRRGKSSDNKNNSTTWRPLFLYANTKPTGTQNPYGSVASVRVGKHFTLAEIRSATNNFDDNLMIGVGGFGKVFKGETEDGTLLAIKRANPQSQQGLAEFETEIEMLSKLRHRHLVSLVGFCEENNEMILVYEYMANGTLRSHLFGSELPSLNWKQRLEICIGAARGLHYLHTGADRSIIHRDVKTTNILLDENFVAKMADFGLSKTGPSMDHTHVSTAVKGSFGYLDPEYFRRQHLTEKSDVYSFGVVLFEVLCARAVINPTLPKDQINLAEWAMRRKRENKLETIVDPRLQGSYCLESLEKFGEIAEKCLADEGKNRPTIGEVLWHLEYVLQLHEAWIGENERVDSFSSSQALNLRPVEEVEEVVPSLDEENKVKVNEVGNNGD